METPENPVPAQPDDAPATTTAAATTTPQDERRLRPRNGNGPSQAVEAPPPAPTRKYYAITPAGREALADFIAEWRRFRDAVESLLAKGTT